MPSNKHRHWVTWFQCTSCTFFLLLFKYKIKKQYTKNTGKKVQEIHADMKCRTNTGLAWLYFFMEKYIFILKSAGIAGNEFYQRNAAIPLLITLLLNEPPSFLQYNPITKSGRHATFSPIVKQWPRWRMVNFCALKNKKFTCPKARPEARSVCFSELWWTFFPIFFYNLFAKFIKKIIKKVH